MASNITSKTALKAELSAHDHAVRGPRGRHFFFAPGPTNIPDRVLGAMNRAPVDFLGEDFLAVQVRATDSVRHERGGVAAAIAALERDGLSGEGLA